jgi:hypothetical protein
MLSKLALRHQMLYRKAQLRDDAHLDHLWSRTKRQIAKA